MKKIYTMLICIIAILILSGCSNQEDKYNSGKEAMNNGDWDKAIECFTDIEYKDSKELLAQCTKEKGMNEKSDYAFLDAMSKSIMKRYEVSEKTDDIEKCTAIELELIGKFKDAEFYDSELQKLAIDYINAVELEKQSITESNGNKQLKYYEGHSKRFQIMQTLTDNYGLLADNVDYKTNYYNNANKESERYSAYKLVEEDLHKQLGDDLECDYVDDVTYRIKIKNNTEYDYDMMMHFIFYDADGTIVDTNEIYYEDIVAGKKYNLDFYFPVNAERFDYYTEEYFEF